MPKISYKQLTKYLEGYKKMENPDPLHVDLLNKVKVLAKALHDAQSTTTQDERQLLYNDMMQYIEIYDSRFQSEPKNGRNNQDLDSLINFGNSINAKVNALVSKSKNENFTNALNDLSASVNANTQAVREGADSFDLERYSAVSYKVLDQANKLAAENKLDQATADMMIQLNANLELIKASPAISTADKRGAARAISRIMTFYSENLFDPQKRQELRSTDQLKSLSKNVNALMTENQTALEAVRKTDPEAANVISEKIEKTNTDLFDDMRTLTTMVQANNWADWETRKIQMEQEAIQEHAEQEQQMREEHGFKTVEQQKLQEVVDRSPEQYKNVPFLNGVMDILGIDEKQFPEGEFEYPATNGNMVKRDLRKELATLKTNAINAVTQTANFFAPAHENSHYMTLDEIRQTNDVNYDLTRQCSRFVNSLKLAGRPQAEIDSVNAMTKQVKDNLSNADVNLMLADKYITEYANDDEMAKLPVFSMYEMQGMVPPDMDGNFIRYTHDMTNALNTVEQRMNGNEANRNEKKQLKSTIDNYNAKVKEPLRKLVEETLPAQFTLKNANVNENDVMKTVTAEDVKELYSAYDALYQGIESFKADYSKVKNHTAEEKELFDMMEGVYEKVDNKRKLLGYLADEKGNSLNADIDAFNKLPDEQRKNNEKAKLFAYAMGCKEHLRLGTLLPQYLLDDHNAPRVGNMLSMMNKKKDIDAANEVVEKASKIEWEDGKRSLDSIKDIDLYKKQIGSGHHVYQFATNNDHENFKKVFETTLKTMPESLKNIEAENKNGQKVNINLETVLREQLDKFLFKKGNNGEKVPADLTHTFCWHNALLSNDDGFGGIKTNYNNFGEAEEEVNKFIERLNKNEYNAGFAYNGFDRKEPVGYNQGVALAFAAETAPTGLVPDAKLLDKTTLPLAGGKAKPDQTADVTLVRVEPRYNKNPEFGEENPMFGNPPFYTTPANFRSCVYVGDLPQGLILELEPHYYKGLSAQQMEQKTQQLLANAEKKGLKVGEKYGRSPLTSSVRDYAEFNKPKLISDTANLQVLDYLWGIPTRSTDDMRMEFQMGKDSKGDPKPKLTGMGGAMDNVKPFMIHADDIEGSKKLTNPENMLIITDQMASNVRRWTKKQFTTEEKMLFKKLPKQAQEDFDLRCNSIMLMLEKSKDHEFPDIKNSKGEIEKGGLVTEKGYLRVVSSKELEKINMDSLSLGRNAVSFRERDNVKPVNLFDTLATMPKACHEAMHDKYIAHWTDKKSPIKGDGISAEEAAVVDYSDYDKAFNLIEAERLTVSTPSLMHDVAKMNNDRKKEYGWHKYISGDSKEYTNVINSVAELTNKANYFKALVNLEYDFVKDPATVTQRYPQLAEEIKEARKQRLEFEKKLAKEKGMEPPRSLPPVDKDPLVFHQVQEARNKAREDIEKYLRENNSYRSDLGKQRRRHMVELYNKINHQMEEHAYFTGDTTYIPKKCIMDPETLKIKFESYYPDRRTFEVQGVHQTLSKEYLNAENKVDAKDRKKISDINTKKKLNALNNPEFVELSIKVSENRATDEEKAKFDKFVAKSRRDTFETFTEGEIREAKSQYGDPNTKKGRKVKPTFEQPAQPKPKPKAKGKGPM